MIGFKMAQKKSVTINELTILAAPKTGLGVKVQISQVESLNQFHVQLQHNQDWLNELNRLCKKFMISKKYRHPFPKLKENDICVAKDYDGYFYRVCVLKCHDVRSAVFTARQANVVQVKFIDYGFTGELKLTDLVQIYFEDDQATNIIKFPILAHEFGYKFEKETKLSKQAEILEKMENALSDETILTMKVVNTTSDALKRVVFLEFDVELPRASSRPSMVIVNSNRSKSCETGKTLSPRTQPEPDKIQPPRVQADKIQPITIQAEKILSPRTQQDKILSPRTQPDKIMSPRTQPDKIQPPRTQADRILSPRTQPYKIQPPRTQADKILSPRVQSDKIQPLLAEKIQPPTTIKADKIQQARVVQAGSKSPSPRVQTGTGTGKIQPPRDTIPPPRKQIVKSVRTTPWPKNRYQFAQFTCRRCGYYWESRRASGDAAKICDKCKQSVRPSKVLNLHTYYCKPCDCEWTYRWVDDGMKCQSCSEFVLPLPTLGAAEFYAKCKRILPDDNQPKVFHDKVNLTSM